MNPLFSLQSRTEYNFRGVVDAVNKGNYNSLNHAAASLRRAAIEGIEKLPGPSAVGTPIHTRKGLARVAIAYDVSVVQGDAVIGTQFSRFRTVGEAHEKGIRFRGRNYPPRPFMLPALLQSLPRLTEHWSGAVV